MSLESLFRSRRRAPLFLSARLAKVSAVCALIWMLTAATGCMSAGASVLATTGTVALNALRKVFGDAAAKNYGSSYKEDADNLFQQVAKPITERPPEPAQASAPVEPATTASGPGGSGASAPPASTGPLTLDVGLLKEEIVGGRSIPTPVQDGDTLYDGYGTHGQGDNIKFMFRTNAEAYVYVISIDGTGWIQPMFPSGYAGFANPAGADRTYLFPEGATWAPLDSYRGVEHLYFIASRTARPDLEKSLVAFASRVRDIDSSRRVDEKLAMTQVKSDAPVSRGFEAPRKSVVPDVTTPTGETFSVDAQAFTASGPGDIVVTRWFRHQ